MQGFSALLSKEPNRTPNEVQHMKVSIKKTAWQQDREALSQLRHQVFILEQGVPEDLEWDEHDEPSTHFLAISEQGEPVGCVRLLPSGQISRLCVLEHFRNLNIGSQLLATVETEARAQGMKEIFLHAQTQATNFYEVAGFTTTGGIFLEANIPHRQMFKELA